MHLDNIHTMIENLTSCAKSAIENNQTHIGQYPICEVVDMIKDLTTAEYYGKISKAMDEAKEDDEAEEKYMLQRMKEEYGEGEAERYYNEWRYANGRYAPKGRGSRRGYRGRRYMMPDDYMYEPEYYRDMDRTNGRMYYTSTSTSANNASMGGSSDSSSMRSYNDGYSDGNTRGYNDGYNRGYEEGNRNNQNQRDYREGRSGRSRRSYIDTKNNTTDKDSKMRELEKYANELNTDITEMMNGASPEEKTLMKNKMQTIMSKM